MALVVDVTADLIEMQLHRQVIDPRQHERRADAPLGTGGAEQIGRVIPLVARLTRARALARPAVNQMVLLAYAGLILKPDLKALARATRRDRGLDQIGEVFLNASCA